MNSCYVNLRTKHLKPIPPFTRLSASHRKQIQTLEEVYR